MPPTSGVERKKLTGEYGKEKHPNGRIALTATEQYTDKDGKLQTHKKYVSAETASKLRDDKYRKENALNETPKEKKERMKEAKKRYNKKMAATRRKRAVQKGLQTVARLLGHPTSLQKKRTYTKYEFMTTGPDGKLHESTKYVYDD